MKSDKYNRKKFLTALASVATGGVLLNTVGSLSAGAQTSSLFTGSVESEYLFSEGLTYLNTGTLGFCRRDTIQETQNIWRALESFPLQYYGKSGAELLAEKTRGIAARFLGCDLSEMLMTNSTTSGMNAIAQGLRLRKGDRILTTDPVSIIIRIV